MTRPLTAALTVLFAATLLAVSILLAQALPPMTVVAVVLLLAVFGVSFGLLIATNTHDAPAGVSLPDGRIYGRRVDDEVSVTEELSAVLERAAAQRTGPIRTPDWFSDARVTVTKDEG